MPLELVEFKKNLNGLVDRGELALPSNVKAESFRNAAIIAYQDNPQIARCTPESIFRSVRKLAGMGLVPDGSEAALVPYKHKDKSGRETLVCQAIPMVAGLIKRARNSAEIKSLWAELVYEGEEIVVWVEDGERKWQHDFDPFSRTGEIRGVYAVAKTADGIVDFEPLSKAEIEKIRAVSKAKDGPAWRNWYDEMAKKTAIRRLIKRLPVSTEDRRRIIESDSDTIGDMKDVTPRSLQDRIEAQKGQKPEQKSAEAGEGEGPGPSESSDQKATAHPSPDIEDAETVDSDGSAEEEAQKSPPAKAKAGRQKAGPAASSDKKQRKSRATAGTKPAEGAQAPQDEGAAESPRFTPNPQQGFPMDNEFGEGWRAYEAGHPYESNPYVTVEQQKADAWAGGWMQSRSQKEGA